MYVTFDLIDLTNNNGIVSKVYNIEKPKRLFSFFHVILVNRVRSNDAIRYVRLKRPNAVQTRKSKQKAC